MELKIIDHGTEMTKEIDVLDFLCQQFNRMPSKFLPTLSIANDFLKQEKFGGGQSELLSWKAFEIEKDQFEQLRTTLIKIGFFETNYPEWVKTYGDWFIYSIHDGDEKIGAERKILQDKYDNLRNKMIQGVSLSRDEKSEFEKVKNDLTRLINS